MNKAIFTLVGFLLFLYGFLSLVLSMIGVQLTFLTWLDGAGRLYGFIFRLLMVLGGIIIVALVQTDWKREKLESSQ